MNLTTTCLSAIHESKSQMSSWMFVVSLLCSWINKMCSVQLWSSLCLVTCKYQIAALCCCSAKQNTQKNPYVTGLVYNYRVTRPFEKPEKASWICLLRYLLTLATELRTRYDWLETFYKAHCYHLLQMVNIPKRLLKFCTL